MLEAIKSIFNLADGLGMSTNHKNSILHGVGVLATAGDVELATASSTPAAAGGLPIPYNILCLGFLGAPSPSARSKIDFRVSNMRFFVGAVSDIFRPPPKLAAGEVLGHVDS